jgi:N-dimethylarginine dimethylaminohydrolase
MRRLLMVPPDHYDIVYEINPWMSRARRASRPAAARQWEGLRRVLEDRLGAEIALAPAVAGLPDMVFTANAGLVLGEQVILSRFRHRERRGEEIPFGEWFREAGYQVAALPPDLQFEGEGDALFFGRTLMAGYHWRTSVPAHTWVAELTGLQVLSLHLSDPFFYHLDTCFCPLDERTAAYYPNAFDSYALRVLEANVPDLIAVSPDEARRFACNAVVLDRRVALNTGCPAFERSLRNRGFEPFPTPLDEFLKAGGSAKCLVLHLDRPDPRAPTALQGPASAFREVKRTD